MATTNLFLRLPKRRCNVPTTVQIFRHIASPAFRLGGRSPLPRLDPIRLALQRYQELYGDVLPEKDFVVPHKTDIWPEALWGLKLGEFVLRTRYGAINSEKGGEYERMGFNLNPEPTREAPSYSTVLQALLQYRQLHLNLLVPLRFVVPIESDAWPECAWGLPLGLIVSRIRRGKCYRSRRFELESIGFDYTPRSEVLYQTVKLCLLRYRELHGDMLVPSHFKVPNQSDAWPTSLLGLKLGIAANNIRYGKSFVSRRKELESIGFDYTPRLELSYQTVKLALLRYKELHGDMLISSHFEVPNESDAWPTSLLGLKLGHAAYDIRQGYSFVSKRKDLESIGFDYTPRLELLYQTVKLALLRYKELHGDMTMTDNYRVPQKSNLWPESMLGLKLGKAAAHIRAGDSFVSRREELESIGFDYTPRSEVLFQSVILALQRYKELHGDMLVRSKFKVPKSNLWPESLLGLGLGKTVYDIRRGKCYVSRRDELESIGFDYTTKTMPSRKCGI